MLERALREGSREICREGYIPKGANGVCVQRDELFELHAFDAEVFDQRGEDTLQSWFGWWVFPRWKLVEHTSSDSIVLQPPPSAILVDDGGLKGWVV